MRKQKFLFLLFFLHTNCAIDENILLPPLVENLENIKVCEEFQNSYIFTSINIEDPFYSEDLKDLIGNEIRYSLNQFFVKKCKKSKSKETYNVTIVYERFRFIRKPVIFFFLYIFFPFIEHTPWKSTDYHYMTNGRMIIEKKGKTIIREIKSVGYINANMFERNMPREKNVYSQIRNILTNAIIDELINL
ncbi:hypothetical protein LEP1GSC195_1771 [Leptospira wolbachii serovar Codice str. CDC]|uniref:Uncharacterized protein n=1 Tax=Leptospira wolbachii serovar Codice str. CDC TaxID=1218599 RepID=R9A2K6_9LEPT|nr:hypothetical protein [Leptospira wolbachii]EOQ96332.1 hypothetical protein LEP1GSC195_1771 [Leptospira wolbachii serovar Codice str. CDC]